MSTILKTKDYDKFKFDTINRPIDKAHVNNLAASLTICNMMDDHPVIVDEDWNIQDGQHRVLAAQKIGETIWYKVTKKFTHEQLIARQVQKHWTLRDCYHSYVKAGNPEFRKLQELMDKYEVNFNQAALFRDFEAERQGKESRKISTTSTAIRTGTFKCVDVDVIEHKMAQYRAITDQMRNLNMSHNNTYVWLSSRMFTKSLFALFDNSEFDLTTMLKKIPMQMQVICPRSNFHEYYKMWLQVYNYKNRNPLGTDLKVPDYE